MPLAIDDIHPGIVAYLDTGVLLRDSRLYRPGTTQFRSGPFLCVALFPGRTMWYELTGSPGRTGVRFAIRPEWRLAGVARWRDGPSYVQDLREPFVGRDVVFTDAARNEFPIVAQDRPRISVAGLAAVRGAITEALGLEFPEESS